MKEQIKGILDSLIKHEIDISQAELQLFSLIISRFSPNLKSALNASISAIYFNDSSDYRSYHYDVIRSLTDSEYIESMEQGELEDFISKLYHNLNPE